jgi:hypothetical protein
MKWQEGGDNSIVKGCMVNLLFTKHYQDDQIKEGDMGGTCSAHGVDEKFVQNFGFKAWKEETTRKT